eukprot:COSAG01_NODE_810_length_13426_cov_7.873790_13_plen_207_part_00
MYMSVLHHADTDDDGVAGAVLWEFTVAELLRSGRFASIVDRARRAYGHKLQVLCDALEQHAGPYLAAVPRPRGGFFLWLALKPPSDGGTAGEGRLCADRLHLELLSRGLMCGLGEHYFGPGQHDDGWQESPGPPGSDGVVGGSQHHGGGQHLRLAFIGCSDAELHEAARRIGDACATVVGGKVLIETAAATATATAAAAAAAAARL